MIIEKNPKQLEAMEQFRKGNGRKACGSRKNLLLLFGKNTKKKITAPAKKPAVTMGTAKNA